MGFPPVSSDRSRSLLRYDFLSFPATLFPFLFSLLFISALGHNNTATVAWRTTNGDGDERGNVLTKFEKYDQSTDVNTNPMINTHAIADEEDDQEKKHYAGEAQQTHNLGLQTWSDESSFLRALEGGHLLLVIILAPWCERGDQAGVHKRASLAAELLDGVFSSMFSSPDHMFLAMTRLAKPLIGLVDASAMDDLWIQSFGPVTHYPALKFILSKSTGNQTEDVQLWDFLGPRETAKDIVDSVLMYWYRFVVSNALSNSEDGKSTKPPIFTFPNQLGLTTFLENHGERLLRPARPRYRHQNKLQSELFNFYMGQLDAEGGSEVSGFFHFDANSSYECNALDNDNNEVHCNSSEKFVQEIDPYILMVQCRSEVDYNYGDFELADGEGHYVNDEIRLQMQQRAHEEFNDLAEEMSHRRDVAFFALNTTTQNGVVNVFRARRYVTYSVTHEENGHNILNHDRRRVIHSVRTDWGDVKQFSPHAIFVPTEIEITEQQKAIHGKGAVKDRTIPIDYVSKSLVPSTIVYATPTIIWFDTDDMAQLAFPWYRKIHSVLFVDAALIHEMRLRSDLSMNTHNRIRSSSKSRLSSEIRQLLFKQHKAIQMFYNAALWHRLERPYEDVVFLVIPSSNVRVLTSFGLDIWTPLDEALFGMAYENQSNANEDGSSIKNNSGYCSYSENKENSKLPVVMITDSSGRFGMQSSRYYLCSDDIFSPSRVTFNNGGAIAEFIDDFFVGTIGKPFIRSEIPLPTSQINSAQVTHQQDIVKPNVTVLTGNTFESLVMDEINEHTMLLMQSATCGHCKRFSIFWNELSTLIQAMNWSNVIKVMKIDVAKNDIPHNKVNAWDVPSVYYFPANEKLFPIEMTPITMQNSSPQNDYDEGLSWVTSGYDLIEWMVNQGKLDLDLLMRLDK